MAPVGRWAKNRDLTWYARANESRDDGENPEQRAARERKEEIQRVKQAEEDALARALGWPVLDRSNANLEPLGAKREAGAQAESQQDQDAGIEIQIEDVQVEAAVEVEIVNDDAATTSLIEIMDRGIRIDRTNATAEDLPGLVLLTPDARGDVEIAHGLNLLTALRDTSTEDNHHMSEETLQLEVPAYFHPVGIFHHRASFDATLQ